MYVYGSRNNDVGVIIEVRSIGAKPVTIGRDILALVGYAARGPVSEVVALAQSSDARDLYYAGDLKEAIELAFGQSCGTIFARRVLGSGAAIATYTATDGLDPANDVAVFNARSEGAWGNAITITISKGDIDKIDTQIFVGDGTVGPYALNHRSYVTATSNFIKVNGVLKTIVYTAPELGDGKVYLDKTNGKITFYTGQGPTTHDQVHTSLKHETVTLMIKDNETTEYRKNIHDLIALEAACATSYLIRCEPEIGETHLPVVGKIGLVGGDDGLTPTVDDWADALADVAETCRKMVASPTCVALTSYECEELSYDLFAEAEEWAMEQNIVFAPCMVFLAARENSTKDELLELGALYNNRHIVIVGNPWDTSNPRKNLAVARAAKECAVGLGESCAKEDNALAGPTGLLTEFNETEVVSLTRNGIDILEKSRGIKPHKAITTASDDSFIRCVDQRTINWAIVITNHLCRKYLFERNTVTTRRWVRESIASKFDQMKRDEIIYDYRLVVYADDVDPNKVIVEMAFIPVGHIEWFDVKMNVGVYADLRELQGEKLPSLGI